MNVVQHFLNFLLGDNSLQTPLLSAQLATPSDPIVSGPMAMLITQWFFSLRSKWQFSALKVLDCVISWLKTLHQVVGYICMCPPTHEYPPSFPQLPLTLHRGQTLSYYFWRVIRSSSFYCKFLSYWCYENPQPTSMSMYKDKLLYGFPKTPFISAASKDIVLKTHS